METMTIKRNGVYIIFPARENAPFKHKDVRKKSYVKPVSPSHRTPVRPHIKPEKNVGKRCMHCGEAVWRNDVSYCWECYKYEHFESK